MVKKLYDWVLSWSESRWGWIALFVIALFEASWFPLPPDILLIALCLGATKKSFRFASLCLVGSIHSICGQRLRDDWRCIYGRCRLVSQCMGRYTIGECGIADDGYSSYSQRRGIGACGRSLALSEIECNIE